MSDLERRYSRLLRVFYPADYRQARGTEIVGTYLDLAGPDRRWPSVADVLDLAGGGLRHRMHAAEATGLAPGLRLAGPLALLAATVLAAAWAVLEVYPPSDAGTAGFGRFVSLGVVIWAAWLLAAAAHLVAPGGRTRIATGVAMLLTATVVPFAALTGQPRPPLFVLLPQLALGSIALAGIGRAPVRLRLLPLTAGAAAVPPAAIVLAREDFFFAYYGWHATQVPSTVGVGLLVVSVVLGVALALKGDHRGGWALLVLLGPIGMLSLHPLAGALDGGLNGAPNPTWPSLVAVAVTVAIGTPALVTLALAARRRSAPDNGTGERCTTCGAPAR